MTGTKETTYQSIDIPEGHVPKKNGFSGKAKCGILTLFVLVVGIVFTSYLFKWGAITNNNGFFRFNIQPAGPPGVAAPQAPRDPEEDDSHGDDKAPPIGACAPEPPAPWTTIFLLAAYDFSQTWNFNANNHVFEIQDFEGEELANDFLMERINKNDINYLKQVANKHLNGSTSFGLEREIHFDEQLKDIISEIDRNFRQQYPNTLNQLTKKEIRLSKINKDVLCSHALHADATHLDGTSRYGYEDVKYTAIVYLSHYNEFIGGELEFISPFLEKTIVAHKGNGLLFSSGADHLHKVNPIKQGERYTLRILYQ